MKSRTKYHDVGLSSCTVCELYGLRANEGRNAGFGCDGASVEARDERVRYRLLLAKNGRWRMNASFWLKFKFLNGD
jgi:hypothetical protein